MTTVTIDCDASNAAFDSYGNTYAEARDGTYGLGFNALPGSLYGYHGQFGTSPYYVKQMLLNFDTSSIPDDATINSAVLSLYFLSVDSGFGTSQARLYNWGDTAETTDYVAGGSLSGKTLLATLAADGLNGRQSYISQAAFVSNINVTGKTRMLLCSAKTVANTASTDYDQAQTYVRGPADVSFWPHLIIDYTPAGGGGGGGGTPGGIGSFTKTDYAEKKHLEHGLGIAAWTMPSASYLALFTSDPTEAGLTASEVTGGSYARAAITWGATGTGIQIADAYTMANTNTVTFPTSTGAWSSGSNITHAALMDASSAGNMLRFVELNAPITVAGAGTTFTYAPGDILASEG